MTYVNKYLLNFINFYGVIDPKWRQPVNVRASVNYFIRYRFIFV